MTRIVLAYSGSLDSSVAIPWLADRRGADIIAVTIDLGQGKDVLEEIRDRALATGALRAHVIDARDQYLRDSVLRGLRADSVRHGVGHRAVDPGADQAPAAVHGEIARRPDRGRTDVGREHRVF